jgi:hypothetical protein
MGEGERKIALKTQAVADRQGGKYVDLTGVRSNGKLESPRGIARV